MQAAAALALLAVLALLTLGHLPLVDEDEGEYSEVAMEMARSGDFLAPTLNGHAFYEKPILLFWLQAPLLRIAHADSVQPSRSVHPFAGLDWLLRLPSWCASLAWMLALLHWWRRRGRALQGVQAAWLAACSLGICLVARAAAMEALINLFLALTLFDLWDWLHTGRRRFLRRAAFWSALGFLAKGPVALVLPGAVVLVFVLCTPASRQRLRDLPDGPAWSILFGVCMPWYVWYDLHSQGAFFAYFFGRENVGRLGGSLQGHGGGYAYYLIVLPVLLLPFSALLWPLLRGLRSDWQSPERRFLWVWFLVVLLIFTLAGTKLPHYLLYGCTPLCLMAAPLLARWRVTLAWPVVVLPALALALPALAAQQAAQTGNPYLHEMLARAPLVLDAGWWRLAILWNLLAWFSLWLVWRVPVRQDPHNAWWQVCLAGMVAVVGVSCVLLPPVCALQQDPVRHAAQVAALLDRPVVSDDRMPSFSVYLGRATQVRAVQAGDVAFGRLDHPERLGRVHQVLFAEGGIRLVRVLEP